MSTTPAINFSPVLLTPLNSLLPVSLTPVINKNSRISPRIFEKIQNGSNGILGGLEDTRVRLPLIYESLQKLTFFTLNVLFRRKACSSIGSSRIDIPCYFLYIWLYSVTKVQKLTPNHSNMFTCTFVLCYKRFDWTFLPFEQVRVNVFVHSTDARELKGVWREIFDIRFFS